MRWVLKWAATVACGLTVAAMAASLYWQVIEFRAQKGNFAIAGGAFGFAVPTDANIIEAFSNGVLILVESGDWREIERQWSKYGAGPIVAGIPGVHAMSIPLWIPLVLFGVLTGWLWWWDRRRIGPGSCPACGYDLTGNVSGTCPECGRAIASKPAPAQATRGSDR